MMKCTVSVLILFSLELKAQSVSTLLGAKAAGMGYASGAVQNDCAMFNNVAGVAKERELRTSASYEIQPALVSGRRFGVAVSSPFSFGVIGLAFFRFGDNVYNEQLIAIGLANKIGNTSLGGRVSYIQYTAQGFGTHGTIGLDLGGITQLSKQFFVAAWIQNLNQPKLKFGNKERVALKMYATLAFKPTEKFYIATEVEKDVLYPLLWKTGMEYAVYGKFFLRVGLNVNPNSAFAGLGFESWRIRIDYSLQAFSQVTSAHQASASYRLSKPKSKIENE